MLAVITNDIVGSTKLNKTEYCQVIDLINQRLQKYETDFQCAYSLYRGDEFQLIVPDPTLAARLMLEIKLFLNSQINHHQINCTQSMAIGEGTLDRKNTGLSTGKAFVRSGRQLDEVKHGEFLVHIEKPSADAALIVMCSQLSYILNRLSQRQAALLFHYIEMDFPAHQKIATLEKTSRQNISERIKAAGGDLLAPFIDYINSLVE